MLLWGVGGINNSSSSPSLYATDCYTSKNRFVCRLVYFFVFFFFNFLHFFNFFGLAMFLFIKKFKKGDLNEKDIEKYKFHSKMFFFFKL